MKEKTVNLLNKTILITGAAGFIGAKLVECLLAADIKARIVGVDNINDYYDTSLKDYRLAKLDECTKNSTSEFIFSEGTIADK